MESSIVFLLIGLGVVALLFITLDIVTRLRGFGLGCLGAIGWGLLAFTLIMTLLFATI
ncbi:hypothetical protein [Bacillus toyonensis]|uniref:hypothetical protein n=1 Tax=Bacillus toyonensis TaxID=155322 RepID=UPI00159BCA99|nr:hypothetical protein [Bacillus toyonensis]